MLRKHRVKFGYVMFPIWNISESKEGNQILQLWAEEMNKVHDLQHEKNPKYSSPEEVIRRIQNLCSKKGIKTKIDWGLRFVSCNRESFFLTFVIQKKLNDKSRVHLLERLRLHIQLLYLNCEYREITETNM